MCVHCTLGSNLLFGAARALLAMGGEASEADDGADEYRHDADGGEEWHVKDENKYEDELQNLSEITSQFPDNSRKPWSWPSILSSLGFLFWRKITHGWCRAKR